MPLIELMSSTPGVPVGVAVMIASTLAPAAVVAVYCHESARNPAANRSVAAKQVIREILSLFKVFLPVVDCVWNYAEASV